MFGQAIATKNTPIEERNAYYNALFSKSSKYIEVRIINGNEGVKKQLFFTYEELLKFEPPMEHNVYVGLFDRYNTKSGKIENCFKTKCLWADFDDMTLDEIRYRIEMSKLPTPSMIVGSGNGYHVYWILNKVVGHEIKPLLQAMVKRLGADDRATDIARVLRVPGTNNVKETPIPCEIVQSDNGLRTSVKQLESILGVKAQIEEKQRTGAITELLEVTFNGLHNMAYGVGKGERNFCTGRITQTLKRLNYTKQEVKNIVVRWNKLNTPVKNEKELLEDVETYWHAEDTDKQYRYAGKEFSNERLQELNKRFITENTTFFKSDEVDSFHYDNDLLGDNFYKIDGLTFAILGIVKLAKETKNKGVTRQEIANLCRRHINDKTMLNAISFLEKHGHIGKKAKKGYLTYYYPEEKPFSEDRGFTSVPRLLHRLFISEVEARELEKIVQERGIQKRQQHRSYERLNELRYKLLILMESYAYDSKRIVFVSNRMIADRMRIHSKTVKRNLEWLEENHYISTYLKNGKRYIKMIYA